MIRCFCSGCGGGGGDGRLKSHRPDDACLVSQGAPRRRLRRCVRRPQCQPKRRHIAHLSRPWALLDGPRISPVQRKAASHSSRLPETGSLCKLRRTQQSDSGSQLRSPWRPCCPSRPSALGVAPGEEEAPRRPRAGRFPMLWQAVSQGNLPAQRRKSSEAACRHRQASHSGSCSGGRGQAVGASYEDGLCGGDKAEGAGERTCAWRSRCAACRRWSREHSWRRRLARGAGAGAAPAPPAQGGAGGRSRPPARVTAAAGHSSSATTAKPNAQAFATVAS